MGLRGHVAPSSSPDLPALTGPSSGEGGEIERVHAFDVIQPGTWAHISGISVGGSMFDMVIGRKCEGDAVLNLLLVCSEGLIELSPFILVQGNSDTRLVADSQIVR